MKQGVLFKTAALLMLLHLAGHIFGHATWRMAEDPVQLGVIDGMSSHRFPFMGAIHSIADYYEGYGWLSAVAMVYFCLVFWISSSIPPGAETLIRKIIVFQCVILLFWGLLEFMFFFPFAASVTWASSLVGFIGLSRTGRKAVG